MRPTSHALKAPPASDLPSHSPEVGPLSLSAKREDPPSLYDLADLYDLIVPPGPCEAFYRREARRWGGPVLELGCGTGRLTLPLAQDGHDVTGLDASHAMLAAARRKAARAAAPVTFAPGDMRDFDLGRRFGLILVGCNSLAHLVEADDLRACLQAIRRHLAPGGALAFDVMLPDVQTLALPPDGPRRLDLGPNPASAVEAEETAQYDPVTQVRTSWWRVRGTDGRQRDMAPLVLRQFFPQELPLLLEAAGFELVERHGDFARNPLSPWSLNQICVARVQTDAGS